MKLFKTNNLETVTYCRMQLNFDLPSTIFKKKWFIARKYRLCSNVFCTLVDNVADVYYFYLFVFFIICYHCLMMNKVAYNITEFERTGLNAAPVTVGFKEKYSWPEQI